jgi:sugar lactone lactonase YvrE
MKHRIAWLVVLPLVGASAALPLLLDGCSSDDAVPGTPTADASTDTFTSRPDTGQTGDTGTPDASDASTSDVAEAAPPTLSFVANFDAGAGEQPEGIVLINGNLYVSFARLSRILEVTPQGATRVVAQLPVATNPPPPQPPSATVWGLQGDDAGNVYISRTNTYPYNGDAGPDAAIIPPGVYRVPATHDGGPVTTPWATHPSFRGPNSFAFDPQGNLYVTDSFEPSIFKITSAGTVSIWTTDPELSNNVDGGQPCATPTNLPIGANGIVYTPTALFVTNTVKGSIVRIAIDGSGNPGAVSTVIKDCARVGLDGIDIDTDGTFLVTQNLPYPGKLLRITQQGQVTELASAAPLDSPSSLTLGRNFGGNAAKFAFFNNSAFYSANQDGGRRAGVLKYGPLP